MYPVLDAVGQPVRQGDAAVQEDDATTWHQARAPDFDCRMCLDLLCDPVVGEPSHSMLSYVALT